MGVPVFIVIVGLGFFWLRNHRRQSKEFVNDDDVDLELQDDGLYSQFHQQLTKKMHKEKVVEELPQSLTITESVEQQKMEQVTKPDSFYDTFIPVIGRDMLTPLLAATAVMPGTPRDMTLTHLGVLAPLGLVPPTLSAQPLYMLLEMLAKNLHSAEFFEKLPLRAAPPLMQQKLHSSLDLLNTIVGEDAALNDNFVYEAQLLESERDKSLRQLMRSNLLSAPRLPQLPKLRLPRKSGDPSNDVKGNIEPIVEHSSETNLVIESPEITAIPVQDPKSNLLGPDAPERVESPFN